MKISLQHMVQRNPDILTSQMDEEVVMMSLQKGEYFGLDQIGSRIWNLTENPVCVQDIILVLLTEYDIDKETCERDVLEFLDELSEKGLIKLK